jgi:hypothetical protein
MPKSSKASDENPKLSNAREPSGRDGWVPFFLVTFFGQAKKVTRHQGEKGF